MRRYAALFLVWTAFGLFMFSQGVAQAVISGDKNPWWNYLASWMAGVWLWFLLTPAVLWLGRRFPFERKRWARRAAVHLAIAPVLSILELAVEAVVLRALGLFPTIMTSYAATLAFLLIIGFHQGCLTYGIVLGVQYAYGWYRRYEERRQAAMRLELRSSALEKQLVEAHLSALKMQLQPHFLFNTLNAIMVLIRQHRSGDAEEMLGRLSVLLRCVLEEVQSQEIPLSRELEYLRLYLAIEEVRFQDRLRVEIAADPETLDAAVPHMGLQPLVENAIRHGIGRSSSAGLVGISARRVNQSLEIRIKDDGPGLRADDAGTRGIGLANTRARLAQLYGDAARLTVENGEAGGAIATMILPYRMAPESESTEVHALYGAAG